MQKLIQFIRALADETRLRILSALCEGQATVTDLVVDLDLPQPRISSHLAVLRQAGLVSVQVAGRQHTYGVDRKRIGAVLAALQSLLPQQDQFPPTSAQAGREVRRNTTLRQGRTCYDHLAGVAGVTLLDGMLRKGWLETESTERPRYRVTRQGEQALQSRGVDLDKVKKARRQFAFGCLDWTERRPHLGGALGAAILSSLDHQGYVKRRPASRALTLVQSVENWLHLS